MAFLFGCLWTTIVGAAVFGNYYKAAHALKHGDFGVVEGRVTHFVPMPPEGHAWESFDVNGVEFSYSDFDLSKGGFNQTASHGGPIREGLPVRIAYKHGTILRLEVGR